MILEKKTALLSPRGARGLSGVARFECFKEKSDVKISLNGAVKDLYAVVAVGEELRVVRPCADRVYLARTDLSGDCAVIVADGEKRVLCAGATRCGYDFSRLEEFLITAYGRTDDEEKSERQSVNIKEETKEESRKITEDVAQAPTNGDIADEKAADEVAADKDCETEKKSEKEENAAEEKTEEKPATASETDIKKETAGDARKKAVKEKKKVRFFDRIADKIGRLLEDNEREEELCALIPDSRWVRVKADDGAYVVGVVGDPVEFICYGIPAENQLDPPDEEKGCRQWLEVVKGGRGYWMMYQSAETGETLTADVI